MHVKDIKEFDLTTVPEYFSMVINGVRRSGKSRVLDWMINKMGSIGHKSFKFDEVYLLSSTAGQQDDVFNFIDDDEHIIDELSDDKIRAVLDKREKIFMQYKENPERYDQPVNCLVIVDDLLTDKNNKNIFYSKPVSEMYFKGRHLGLSVVILTQYLKSLPPLIRSNTDVCICFRDLRKTNRDTIISEYMLYSDDREKEKEARQLLQDLTSTRYTAVCINRYIGQYASGFSEYVFKIKSEEKYNNKAFKLYPLPKDLTKLMYNSVEAENKEIVNNGFKSVKKIKNKLIKL
jgi:hypothetical protein